MKCLQCNREIEDKTAKYCPFCGLELVKPLNEKKFARLIIVAAIFSVIALVLGILFNKYIVYILLTSASYFITNYVLKKYQYLYKQSLTNEDRKFIAQTTKFISTVNLINCITVILVVVGMVRGN